MAAESRKKPSRVTSWHGKPYNFFGDYLRAKYHRRVLKLPIDAGFTCPNRDGSLSYRGCTFCSETGSASPTALISDNIHQQMEHALESFKRSEQDTGYIAYFQSFTNTYAPVADLKLAYDAALSFPEIQGLMIGTRPDQVNDDVLDLVASYMQPGFELWLELGMQSCHDTSLERLNRGHNHGATVNAAERAAARNIPLCVHVILGIPGETWDDMMETALEISRLPVQGVKIHHLHIIRGTILEQEYNQGEVPLLPYQEYISLVVDFMERLRPDIIIHRLVGDQNEQNLVAPAWGHLKGTVLRDIEDAFHARGTWQGFLIHE